MKTITKKSVVQKELHSCLTSFEDGDLTDFVSEFKNRLLDQKVKFPLLEYCGSEIYDKIAKKNHIELCDMIESLKTEGGNVVIGIILQNRLSDYFRQSTEKAVEYISKADEWYVPDIIGERVFGWALLHQPENALQFYRKLIFHDNKWVVRSLGAGTHNAVKNELGKHIVKELFPILMTHSDSTDHQIKRGIGWAAKTIAKFHPDIIREFKSEIDNKEQTGRWFQSKVEMGLKRNRHAQGN